MKIRKLSYTKYSFKGDLDKQLKNTKNHRLNDKIKYPVS